MGNFSTDVGNLISSFKGFYRFGAPEAMNTVYWLQTASFIR